MKEYEISYNDKDIGKVKLFKDNLNKNIKNSLITSNKKIKYNVVDSYKEQKLYEVTININDVDDLYDIVKLYIYNEKEIYDNIDKIKEYNNIKTIKKDTNIKIIIPEIYLNNLSISKENIDKESLFKSKVYFIKSALNNYNNEELNKELNTIIQNYTIYKNSNEYEFLTDEELSNNINKYIDRTNSIIKIIEINTKYRYGKDYIIPIKINKQ